MVNQYQPTSLQAALEILAQERVTPYAGGTDLMIEPEETDQYLFLNKIPELKQIVLDGSYLRLGAACTFTELINSPLVPAILKEAAREIAAPAIRNLGTIGGNICNGSAKADSALILFALNAQLRLVSSQGERLLPIGEFYLGRKKLALQQNELLVEVLIKPTAFTTYYYKKVGARNALAISRVSFAATLTLEDDRITGCTTAFGAVSDVIISRPAIDALLIGKTIEESKGIKEQYLHAYDQEIVPIRGRVSAEYRNFVCMNLLSDFLSSNGI